MLVLAQGELAVLGDVTIDGDVNGDDAPDITVDGAGASTVFHIYSGTATLNGLTITGGNSSYGGGVAVGSYFFGTTADVTISNSAIVEQRRRLRRRHLGRSRQLAPADQFDRLEQRGLLLRRRHRQCRHAHGHQFDRVGQRGQFRRRAFYGGGGIYNVGTATLIGSTISGNGGAFAGGGIYNTDELTLVNTTVSENYARTAAASPTLSVRCGSSTVALSTRPWRQRRL